MKFLILLILIIPGLSIAEINLNTCTEQTKVRSNFEQINKACLKYAILNSSATAKVAIEEYKLQAYAWKNTLFIKVNDKTNILTGADTRIKKIESIIFSDNGNEIYVLNNVSGVNEILVFKTNRDGNVKPRTIQDSTLKNARSISLNEKTNEIYILKDDMILTVSSKSNSGSKIEKNWPIFKILIKNTKINHTTQIVSSKKEIFILDKTNEKVLVVDIKTKSLSDEIVLADNNFKLPTYMEFNTTEDKLKIFNNKSSIEFQLE